MLDLPEVLALMDGAHKRTVDQYTTMGTLEFSSAPFTRFRNLDQIMAVLFQLCAIDSTGCVPDVSVLMPSNCTQLNAKELRHQDDAACLGGMRGASSSVVRPPSAFLLGKQIRDPCW